MNEHIESSPIPRQDIGSDGELRTEINDARWRYDKVMEAVTGADIKASIIATVQAAALGALLTTDSPSTLTAHPARRCSSAASVRSWPVSRPPARRSSPDMGCAAHRRSMSSSGWRHCHTEASADAPRSEFHVILDWQEHLIADDRDLQPVAW
ncbi:MAG: hypothetical protein ACJ75K_04885 [Actinomycetes bacterium]